MRALVIIPVHNRPTMVLEALESVVNQSLPATRILVLDDGSTDDTAIEVERWIAARSNSSVRLHRLDHRGAPSARNAGLKFGEKEADAVAFLDSDDIWPKDFLQRTVEVLHQDRNAVAVSVDRELWNVRENSRKTEELLSVTESPWLYMLKHGGGLGSCTLFRLRAVQDAGGFPKDVPTGHDLVLFGRIAGLGTWGHVPGEPVIFRRHYSGVLPGESDHLHKSYANYRALWAAAAERLLADAPAGVRRQSEARILLSRFWRKAAREAVEQGDRNAAWRYRALAIRHKYIGFF
jgi:glycosyltransferase involved in cell wall biosynthesis